MDLPEWWDDWYQQRRDQQLLTFWQTRYVSPHHADYEDFDGDSFGWSDAQVVTYDGHEEERFYRSELLRMPREMYWDGGPA